MPVATTPSPSPRPSTLPKMEDRKRPLGSAEETAPPSKRLAVNGAKTKDDSAEGKEDSWIEAYTKGAIYRQMQEYSRKATIAESRLEEIHKRSVHHDDHLRVIDAWLGQVLDEMELLVTAKVSSTSSASEPPYLSSVAFKDLHDFQKHLQDKQKSILARADALLTKLDAQRGEISPEAKQLETQIARLKTAEKDLQLKLDRLSSEKDQMSDQLNAATLRFFKAEKKLDRAKSTQVQKLEQQAMASARGSATSEPDAGSTQVGETNGSSGELLMKYEEATATSTKQKEQLDNLLSEIKSIQDENSALKAKRESLSDEDFVRTDVFKQLKGQSEDLIKRVNNLEATNKQLREEAEKLQAERSACRAQFENEANQVAQDLESEVAARDQDLARVRSARDEILAENTQRKSSMEQEKAAIDNLRDLLTAKDERILSLEHQISRLATEQDQDMTTADVADELSPEDLKTRYLKLEQDFKSINQELPAIEKAYKKMKDLAQKKVMDFATLEERLSILIAEKSKADQKYFAARKDADTRNNEIRSLRHQNSKSAEIIAQLKDLEAQTRSLLTNFEKQMADLKQTNTALVNDNKKFEASANDASRRNETLGKQVAELTSLLKTKDSATAVMREKCATQETEVEKTKVRLDHMQKERDNWKSKALGNTSKEEEDLRAFALCTICRNNFKSTALKTCGHLFCKECIDDRISNRMRKCPSCARSFDKMDVMSIHF